MKIFVSWSGQLSKQIAGAITEWLPSALQNVKPWFSEEIEKGANWQNELSNQLKDTRFSIIVLTPEALKSDGIMFEAGATANAVGRTHACPILFGLEPADVKGPLASLQLTRFDRHDFFKLFKTINTALGDSKLDDQVVNQVFAMWWRNLEERINAILMNAPQTQRKRREVGEIVEETLLLVRAIQNSLEEDNSVSRSERRVMQQLRNYVAHKDSSSFLLAALLQDKDKLDFVLRDSAARWAGVESDAVKRWLDQKTTKEDKPPEPTKE